MTLAALRSQARRYARVDTTAADDDQVNLLIQDSVDKFARDVGGFPEDVNLAIAAAFDTETNFAFHVKIVSNGIEVVDTDVPITATAREDATGTTVASDLQTALRAMTGAAGTETATWTDFYFTVDLKQGQLVSGDYVSISEPSADTYVDATEILNLSGTKTDSTVITGGFPPDCTQYVTLPSDAVSVERVEWDYNELIQTSLEYVQSSEAQGDPTHYAVRGRRIYLVPSPDEQDRFEVWYRGLPTSLVLSGYQECGLSGISDEKSTGLSATTDYYFKVTINGEQTEYSITTASDLTYSAVIALMNAEITGASFSIVGGDLRCTSDAVTGVSTIALAAGTTGTDLFDTLTGFSAFETAVAGDTDVPSEIPEQYQEAVVWLTATYLAYEQFDYEIGDRCERRYLDIMRRYRQDYANYTTTIEDNAFRKWPRVPSVLARRGLNA
jgi:hypothetical protein